MTLKTADSYAGLITSQHQGKPRFYATVVGNAQFYVDAQGFIASLPAAFDIDYAVGAQLNIVGQWVGATRTLPVPVANIYFALGIKGGGLGQGYWKGPYDDATTIGSLDDDTYRRLLYAKVAANNSDGTIPTTLAILNTYFKDADTFVIVQDETMAIAATDAGAQSNVADLRLTIGITGSIPTILDLEVLSQKKIPVATSGVETNIVVTTIDGAPLFGLGVQNDFIAGLGSGALGMEPGKLAGTLSGEFN